MGFSYTTLRGRGYKVQEKELKVIKKFKDLVSSKVNLQEIKVFGSRARGEATEDSDLDLFLVVDSLDHDQEKYISDCAWEAGFADDILIMPITVTLDALQNSAIRESTFIKNAYYEGIPV